MVSSAELFEAFQSGGLAAIRNTAQLRDGTLDRVPQYVGVLCDLYPEEVQRALQEPARVAMSATDVATFRDIAVARSQSTVLSSRAELHVPSDPFPSDQRLVRSFRMGEYLLVYLGARSRDETIRFRLGFQNYPVIPQVGYVQLAPLRPADGAGGTAWLVDPSTESWLVYAFPANQTALDFVDQICRIITGSFSWFVILPPALVPVFRPALQPLQRTQPTQTYSRGLRETTPPPMIVVGIDLAVGSSITVMQRQGRQQRVPPAPNATAPRSSLRDLAENVFARRQQQQQASAAQTPWRVRTLTLLYSVQDQQAGLLLKNLPTTWPTDFPRTEWDQLIQSFEGRLLTSAVFFPLRLTLTGPGFSGELSVLSDPDPEEIKSRLLALPDAGRFFRLRVDAQVPGVDDLGNGRSIYRIRINGGIEQLHPGQVRVCEHGTWLRVYTPNPRALLNALQRLRVPIKARYSPFDEAFFVPTTSESEIRKLCLSLFRKYDPQRGFVSLWVDGHGEVWSGHAPLNELKDMLVRYECPAHGFFSLAYRLRQDLAREESLQHLSYTSGRCADALQRQTSLDQLNEMFENEIDKTIIRTEEFTLSDEFVSLYSHKGCSACQRPTTNQSITTGSPPS